MTFTTRRFLFPLFFMTGATLFSSACGEGSHNKESTGNEVTEAWGRHDDPFNLDSSYVRRLESLPSTATLPKTPWAGYYWSNRNGGVAHRWNDPFSTAFTARPPRRDELLRMTPEQVARLSPAEKMDILNRRYDYPFQRYEVSRTSPNHDQWWGLCHGWAPASDRFQEPLPITVRNADGIVIPFGSSDIKALLVFNQGQYARPRTRFLGKRCNVDLNDVFSGRAEADDCKGVNPGAFHIVLANQIGLRKESFMADVVRDLQVWNHPISAFRSTIRPKSDVGPNAAPGTVQEVFVETAMTYSIEIDPQWNLVGEQAQPSSTKVYRYTLELNSRGEVIGGEWLTEERPDFLWKQEAADFFGYFRNLGILYRMSIAQR